MANPEPRSSLADVPIFAGLRDATLRALEAQSRMRRYPAGQILCSEGDPGEDLLLLEAGTVRVSRYSASGHETVLAEAEAPTAFGELALIDGEPRSATITAFSDVTVRYLGRQVMLGLIEREPGVALAMMRGMAAMIRATNEQLVDLLSLDVPGRLAKWLLSGAGEEGRVTLAQSQESLARALGTTRESLNRSLHRFERLGWIEVEGRQIRVRNRAALESLVAIRPS